MAQDNTAEHCIQQSIAEHLAIAQSVARDHAGTIAAIAAALIECMNKGGAIYWCGNGGSAADSQHLAAELIGRFKRERRAIRSAALTTDTSVLTALGNDYGFHTIFSRQIEGMGRKGDILVGISTSGNSENILLAMQQARKMGMDTVGFLGRDGGKIKAECQHAFIVPSSDTARIQEMHIMAGHIACDLVEQAAEHAPPR